MLVFSDVLVLTGRQANASGGVRASVVLAQFDLTATELEDDSLLSWSEDSESSSAGVAGAAASASSGGGKDGEEPKRGFLGFRRTDKSQEVTEQPAVTLNSSPDMSVWNSQSPAFRLASGETKWLIQCADKPSRVALTECILNQKFKYRVFGQSISFLAERDGDSVPEIVRQCARELRRKTAEEGVFRIPGRGALIDSVVKSVDMGMRVDLADMHVHDVAGIFKIWYRQLPAPVVPRPLLSAFVATSALPDDKRCAALRELCEKKLPSNNLRVLSFTIGVLAAFHDNRERSKMDAENLATIFAPALFFALNSAGQTKGLERKDVLVVFFFSC